MSVFRRIGFALAPLVLVACATPRWENLKNPAADLQADTSACDREAERGAKMDQLARPMEFQNDCPTCKASVQSREIQTSVNAFGVQKHCMAARGWRKAS